MRLFWKENNKSRGIRSEIELTISIRFLEKVSPNYIVAKLSTGMQDIVRLTVIIILMDMIQHKDKYGLSRGKCIEDYGVSHASSKHNDLY